METTFLITHRRTDISNSAGWRSNYLITSSAGDSFVELELEMPTSADSIEMIGARVILRHKFRVRHLHAATAAPRRLEPRSLRRERRRHANPVRRARRQQAGDGQMETGDHLQAAG